MRWTFEILVFLVFAGMALPVIWRMRGLSILRSALSHEPLYMRVAAFALFAATVIYGGGKGDGGGDGGNGGLAPPMPEMSAPPLAPDAANGGDRGDAPTLPGWFALAGRDDADTDGDGIPDCWERWTGTNPLVADSSLDSDTDGLSNLDEFWLQTDPQCADTDNDAIDDALEAAAMFAGVADFDPLAPATYAAPEPDANTNGVPDAWEGTSSPLFSGVSQGGFPNGCYIPDENVANYDVSLTVSSSRFALLSWGDEDSLLLPPCTNLALRLRLDCNETRTVSLSAVPDGAPGGLLLGNWRADMTAEWAPGRDLETEGDRLETGIGTMVDRSSGTVSYRGAVVAGGGGAPPLLRGGVPGGNGGAGGGSIDIHFSPKWMELIYYGGDYCAEHGPSPFVELLATNMAPPYLWAYDLHQTVSSNTLFYVDLPWLDYTTTTVTCREADGAHTNLAIQASINIAIGHCPQSGMNIIPAMAGSTHDPGDPSDHEPEISQPETSQYGPLCPEATNVTLKAGWTHDTAILHIRNLVRILTYNPWDDETDHCIGLVWSAGGATNLFYYLADCCKPYADEFSYYVNGSQCNGTLEFGSEPQEFHPRVFHVELRSLDSGTVLDRMWVVVNSRKSDRNFANWYRKYSDTSWTDSLPKPYAKLQFSTNWLGSVSATPLNPVNPNSWGSPSRLSGYLHHDSVWEMRSEADADNHGNQACYDGNGDIVLNGIGGGTADYFSGTAETVFSHVDEDVNPYLNALHLDGNPGDTGWFNGISRPCLYQGGNLDKYIERRPIIHPEGM